MRKLLLLCAIMFSTIGAWAQETRIGEPITVLTSGKYVLVCKSNKGTGPAYYNESGSSSHYRYDLNKSSVTSGSVIENPNLYVWKVDVLDNGKITIKLANDPTKFFPKDQNKNENFMGTEIAELTPEVVTIDDTEYILLKYDDTIGYIHVNAPGGNPVFSYWPEGSTSGTCVKFQFHPVDSYTYAITDEAGNVYEGDLAGKTEPTFTGVNGYTLSNGAWNGNEFTANITFPFPVSSAEVTNLTLIGQGTWDGADKKWTVVEGNVKVVNGVATSDSGAKMWMIYPTLTGTEFTFKIKSASTGKYVTANLESAADAQATNTPITLTDNGTGFKFINTGVANTNGFAYTNNSSTTLFITRNGSNDNNALLGVYGSSSSHLGNGVRFPDYTDPANMTWPFAVSSSRVENRMMISAFKEGYSGNHGNFQYGFKWYSSGNSVKMKRMHSASVTNLDDFSWAIYPMPVGNNMCYAIKNIKTGKYVYTTAKFTAQNNDNGDHSGDEVELSENPMYFQLNTSNGAFYYYPSGSEITHYLSCNSTTSTNEQFLGVWTSNHNGTKNEFLPLSFKVEVSDLGYATLYSPISVKQTTYIGGDTDQSVEVYSISKEPASGYVTLSSMEGGIPANQGAILENAGTYYFTQDNNVSGDAWSGNLLEGSAVDTYVAGPAYVLANGDNGVGLYKAKPNKNENGDDGTTHFKNNAGKAYLPASAVPSGARFLVFSFGDDVETGITETENGNVKTENGEVYDLAGRRVQGAQKGIFIVNGKKVVR